MGYELFAFAIVVALMAIYVYNNERRMGEIIYKLDQTAQLQQVLHFVDTKFSEIEKKTRTKLEEAENRHKLTTDHLQKHIDDITKLTQLQQQTLDSLDKKMADIEKKNEIKLQDTENRNNLTTSRLQKHLNEMTELGEKCMKGSTFVRWGRNSCDGTKSSLVYTGFMTGPTNSARGSGSNYLCLSSNPQTQSFPAEWNTPPGQLYGIGWELTGIDRSSSSNHVDDKDVPCAVCLTKGKTSLMIPGRTSCYAGWTHEYTGFLVSVGTKDGFASTEYVCADGDPESYGSTNYHQGIISFVEVRCGSIPCSKYGNKTKLSCVVCSK